MPMHETLRRMLAPVPDPLLRGLMYRRRFGRWGDFRKPQRFTEHLTARMLYERDEAMAWTCDKLAMKAHAEERCPDLRVPGVLWSGTDLDDVDLSTLPDEWVIKPNHRSGLVYFGSRSTTRAELKRATRGWLRTHDRVAIGEWAYREAAHVLIIEPRLAHSSGVVPVDWKFFVFHGKVRLLERDAGRFTDTFAETFYSPSGEVLDIRNGADAWADAPPPAALDSMVRYAERLAEGFSFMRVDFYDVDGEPWFGELTPYPSGGMDPYEPDETDFVLGRWWRQEETS